MSQINLSHLIIPKTVIKLNFCFTQDLVLLNKLVKYSGNEKAYFGAEDERKPAP